MCLSPLRRLFIPLLLVTAAPAAADNCNCAISTSAGGDPPATDALSLLQQRARSIASVSQQQHHQQQQQQQPQPPGGGAEVALLEAGQLSLADACAESPGGNSHWYMKVRSIVTNNLGGFGPDKSGKKEMRLRVELGSGKGVKQELDLVIQNMTAYYPKDPSKNGLIDGVRDFFRINTRGKSTTKFKARFVDMVTGKSVRLDRFFITWYDIDKTRTSLHEKLLVKDFARYTLTETTKLATSSKGNGGGWRMFNARQNFKGTGVDFNPDALTKKQFDVSVLLQYAKFSKFYFKLKTTGSKTVGRNFMFSGTTKLFRECNAFDCDLWGDPHISGFDQEGLALQELESEALPFEIRSFDRSVSRILPAATQIEAESSGAGAVSALAEEGAESASGSDSLEEGAAVPGDLREGDMWLVKSADVYIQGRFGLAHGGKNSFLKAVAIGGPFLRGNTLVLGTNQGISLWNNQPILMSLNTSFKVSFKGETVFARFHSAVQHIDKPQRTTVGVEVSLPSGIQLVLNRFDTWLGLRVHMTPRLGGQDGECGNFNGNPHDDGLANLQQRMRVRVSDDETVFHMPFQTWEAKHEATLLQQQGSLSEEEVEDADDAEAEDASEEDEGEDEEDEEDEEEHQDLATE